MEKTEVIKASGAIQIENNITLLQRRAWNLLLANAYDELPTREKHQIGVTELTRGLAYSSRNDAHLKKLLKDLVATVLEWNLVGKDHTQVWGVAALLAEIEIENGVCTYAFGPTLRTRLYNPRVYARISLSLQSKFDSKHALALWELCLDYLDESKNYGETPFIPLEKYRQLMGIPHGMYPQFKLLSYWVVKEPLREINAVTDFDVTVEYKRQGRKVIAVKFRMRRILLLPSQSTEQRGLFLDKDMPEIAKELMNTGLSEHDALDVWHQGFNYVRADKRPKDMEYETYIREKIHLLKKQDTSKIRNKTGFLLKAIKENWVNPEFATQSKISRTTRKAAELQRLQQEKTELETEFNRHVHETCHHIAIETPDLVAQSVQAVLDEQPFYRQLYDYSHTPVENYHQRPALAALVDAKLREYFPQSFAVVEEHYHKKLTALDQEIATLLSSNTSDRI